MATKKIYTVTDLGPGDGGKGGVVHKISSMRHAHTIIKVGGAQGSHGVATAAGDRFAFSQFGCGTFEGTKTHLTARFVVSPEGILNEAEQLMYGCGLRDIFGLLTVDEDAVCATPFHGIASRIKEMARGARPRGTVGTGMGEAYRYLERYPDLTIRMRDLTRIDMRDRIAAVRERVQSDCREISLDALLDGDRSAVADEFRLLDDDGFLDYVAARFKKAGELVHVVDSDYLRRSVFALDGVVVVESSHGVLTDRFAGFHPHTSALRTLPRFTLAMLGEVGYSGEVVNLGVTRAYQVRHGAGPMPTADPAMDALLLPGSHKDDNRFQGKVHVGPLDLVLLRYAIAACGGREVFDGLAVTWFDQIQNNRCWKICDRYSNVDRACFTSEGDIAVQRGEDDAHLAYQEHLGEVLRQCVPEISAYPIAPDSSRTQLFDFCSGILGQKLGVPVRLVSFGQTERDKVCR